ncbi:hypothetical protein CLV63_104131 [Murinocardiopsis flavida]|uniref:MFS transporter n=1 Tax=Murinocardiopsis flavida TaxID=645275 RepID=A0A2P8DNW6_9ACTN|nr:hypothetical protein [Murinocardiopsis flavida]PSK98907.1 hypothetical protein CLV63_104131 [Murinocardiopsis flavida]
MSPKKKRKNRTTREGRTPTGPRNEAAGPRDEPAAAEPATVRTVSRTPVVLDPEPRWPVAVWSAAAFVWLVGTALFFVLYLAEGFAMLGEAEVTDAARRATGWYLVGLLVCALVVPLGAGVAAALMRRRIAAIGFAVALVASAAVLFSLASPGEFAMGISGAFG